MVAPIVAGAAISAGASLLGGVFGKRDARREQELQREFAQHGIRWRVEDAKAAGVHPLYALGATGLPSYSPSFSGSPMQSALSEAGQNIGRAVGAQQTAEERQAGALGLRLLEAQIQETDARRDYYLSEAARNAQAGNQTATFPYTGAGPITVGELNAADALRGVTEVTPTTTYTRSGDDPSLAAASTPLWRAFELVPGRQIYLPGGQTGDASEALESIGESPILALATLLENEKRQPGFIRWATDQYVPGLAWLRGAALQLIDWGGWTWSTSDEYRGLERRRYRTGGGF